MRLGEGIAQRILVTCIEVRLSILRRDYSCFKTYEPYF